MYKVFEEGMKVNGRTIYAIVNALTSIKFLIEKIFIEVGLPKIEEIESNSWYSQQNWLNAFKIISEKAGPHTLMVIGENIPKNADFPPNITNIEEALASIDVAYHLNHKNANDQILYENGRMFEGIGHYELVKKSGKNQLLMKCENPYNCDFDRGIINTMAKRFQPNAIILHEDPKTCRKLGNEFCVYKITW